ncbi:MAG TPA: 2-succinyl-6-hydroxy-2,4-cyclohexadiene-1-carboxylate synthase [Dehalococcoidia bacterium]|nr:2-succinyl-6-hydroxy-2,4-cyclohexadiene-1-carboxylate synthase [Dehalococcoidia bacterium]
MSRVEVNGIALNVEQWGEGRPLLCLHGFTGSASTWAPFAGAWPGWRIVAVDLIGHGASDAPADPARYAMERAVDDLAAVLEATGVRRATVLGYSMGGRVALHFALLAPERVEALILESASPGIDDAAERAARARSDEELAAFIEREGIEAFVDRWESLPLFATQRSLPADTLARQRAQRLANRPEGLANSLRGMGAGAQRPLRSRLGEIRVPALVIAGALDDRYRALAYEMARSMPQATAVIIPGAGHAPHLERPGDFARAVGAFLDGRGLAIIETREATR